MLVAGLVAAVLATAVVGGVVGWRRIDQQRRSWRRAAASDGVWHLVNCTGHIALDVRVEVRGELIRAVDDGTGGEAGAVPVGGLVELRTTPDPAAKGGGAPMVIVRWSDSTGGRRRMWTAPLTS